MARLVLQAVGMKKTSPRRNLSLSTETVRQLNREDLRTVAGGGLSCSYGGVRNRDSCSTLQYSHCCETDSVICPQKV